MDIYRQKVLDHYKNPRNFGHLQDPDVKVEEGNVTCGDKIVMEVKFQDNRVGDIRFSGAGCAIALASGSMLTEKVKDMTKDQIMKLKNDDMVKMFGTQLTASRTKCATLSLEVLQKGVASSATRRGGG
jgi:nitrogen fixation NifU-like protein